MSAVTKNNYSEDEVFYNSIRKIAEYDCFKDPETFVVTDNPWKRPIRPQTFKYFSFQSSDRENFLSYSAFTANRLLASLNELDFIFLPNTKIDMNKDFRSFYNSELRKLASMTIPTLQMMTLGFVDENVKITGNWTKERFKSYFEARINGIMKITPPSFNLIRNSNYPKQATEMLVIQHALDFLVEASHMARYALGDYGQLQSQLFRILLDEFGYGIHSSKHSTLFKNTLKSIGLNQNSHAYWQFYLNSSLLLNNYFHKITKQPEHFFKYLGAITLAENIFGPYCSNTADLLKEIYDGQADVNYYLEHAHIDKHHGLITYKDILLPAIDLYGTDIIPDIVLGIEQTLYLQELAERDLCEQIQWMSNKNEYAKLGNEISHEVLNDIKKHSITKLIEPIDELSVTHVHDGDELCLVTKGVLEFISGPNSSIQLTEGQAVVIKHNRLHGALVKSHECHYEIHSIGEYEKYANRSV